MHPGKFRTALKASILEKVNEKKYALCMCVYIRYIYIFRAYIYIYIYILGHIYILYVCVCIHVCSDHARQLIHIVNKYIQRRKGKHT